MGTGSIKSTMAVIWKKLCFYGVDVKETHYFKKPLSNKDQKYTF